MTTILLRREAPITSSRSGRRGAAINAHIPVLDIGGTHVSAALVDPTTWTIASVTRLSLDADGSAESLVATFAEAARSQATTTGPWGVAMPDPFDYERGIGQFEGVGKFASLHGVDVGGALREAVDAEVCFVNDADAFALGEWAAGSALGSLRCAAITLGTGVGSGWLVEGVPVDPVVPPGGRIHRMEVDGRPLEDVMSRRAIRRAFAAAGGDAEADVREICAAARSGDARAVRVLDAALGALGGVVARCVAGFGPDVLVIGGSMSASWQQFEPAFRAGAAGVDLPPIRVAADSDRAPLVGAAVHALSCRRL